MADSSLHISNKNRYNWVRDYSRQIVLRVPAGRLAAYSHLGYGRLECPDTLRLQKPDFPAGRHGYRKAHNPSQ